MKSFGSLPKAEKKSLVRLPNFENYRIKKKRYDLLPTIREGFSIKKGGVKYFNIYNIIYKAE